MKPALRAYSQLLAGTTSVRRLLMALLLCTGLLLSPTRLTPQTNLEYQVKAAFLLNFAKFVQWPSSAFADSHSSLAICVLGANPFGTAIDQLVEGEVVNGRKLTVRRITGLPAPHTFQVVFAEDWGKEADRSLSSLGRGVLTVGEGAGFVHKGGMIGFVIEDRRVRFDINQSAAENAALKLSSKLLSVARNVEK